MTARLLPDLSAADLRLLADAVERNRITVPFSDAAIAKLGLINASAVARDLAGMASTGATTRAIALLLQSLASERETMRQTPIEELVITGPDIDGRVRDTSVVVEQLFNEAEKSVLMVWYALYDGRSIFQTLSRRMEANPELKVRLCLDISRHGTDSSTDADIVSRFAEKFVRYDWPGVALPEVFYDPRALQADRSSRAVLHAKCIVIDERKALVTSANPTPAAYHRNIELGVVLSGSDVAEQIERYFSSLIVHDHLLPVRLRETGRASHRHR